MKKSVEKHPKYGYYQLNPIPSQSEVDEFYKKEFYDANAAYFNNSALDVQQQQSDFFNSRWESIYQTCLTAFGGDLASKEVFDIGFGFAQALLYFNKMGMSVSGIEPSIEGVEFARDQGLNVFQGNIEDFGLVGDKKFDIVLLLNVLEHLRNPEETLLNIRSKLLKNNGVLVIDVPNDFNDFQEVANLEYNLDQYWVVRPNHINYFSPTSLKALLLGCNYSIYDYYSSFPLDMFLLFGDQYIGNREVGKLCHNKRVKFEELMIKHSKKEKLKSFYKALADIDLGRTITVYARNV